jgi:hypothetical protein
MRGMYPGGRIYPMRGMYPGGRIYPTCAYMGVGYILCICVRDTSYLNSCAI